MSENNIDREIAAVESAIAEGVQELNELTQELVDLEEYSHSGRPIPNARRYKIRVDGEYHVVEAATISGGKILRLAHRDGPLVFEVIQHLRHGAEEMIPPEARVDLRMRGIVRFTTPPKIVRVTADSNPKEIQAGTYVVCELKSRLGVDPSKELDQVVGGEFRELPDREHIKICGGEVFVSHVRHGRSS